MFVIADDPTTWLNYPPSTLPGTVRAMQDEGETVVGWKWMTERIGGQCCRVGYMVVTTTGIGYFDLDGLGIQSSALHPV